MNISSYRKPKFIKKEDCDPPIKLTIIGAEEITYSRSGTDADFKIVIDLENEVGDKFKLSLNCGNLETVAKFFGDETDQWIDQEIGLKLDPTVKYKGEITGGIVVIPAEEVPGNPATQPANPPPKPVTKLVKKQAPAPVPVGIQIDADGEPLPF